MNKSFRKIACVAALSLMPMLAFAKGDKDSSEGGNGLFLGIDTGYSFGFSAIQEKGSSMVITESGLAGANFGIKAGYNFYFTPMLGVRGYLGYTYGFAYTDKEYRGQNTNFFSFANAVTLNADLLVNLMQTDSIKFGAFVGIGLGYGMSSATLTATSITKAQASGFILPINLGLSLTANNHHRFELGFKVQTLGLSYTEYSGYKITSDDFETNSLRFFTTSVGYSYVF